MLVLTRKFQESILIGDSIRITVVEISGYRVRIGIEAPKDTKIWRGEVCPTKQKGREDAQDQQTAPATGATGTSEDGSQFINGINVKR